MIVTRFAPSPTGRLHVGHAYSALFAERAARQAGGRFLLRIEDIDVGRCRTEFEEGIYEDQERRDAILEIARFRSTADAAGWVSLAGYKARAKEGQQAIYYITGDDAGQLAKSPQVEGYRARGIEVLLLTDPVDSFSNVSQIVEVGTSAPLGPGLVILSNWSKGAKLSIAFKSIATTDPNGGSGGAGGGNGDDGPCSADTSFTTNAVPALAPCTNCHGGNNAKATNAVDMTQLDSNPAAACGQIYNRVDLNNPEESQLFVTTNPQVANGHPFKFGGNNNIQNFNNFVSAVTTWIQAEN